MVYTLSYQQYKYEHGLTAAEQRAADIRAGEAAAELGNLWRGIGGVFRLGHHVRAARGAAGAVTGGRAAAPVRVLSSVR